jgi:nickel-dependent lactate racemase
MSTFSLPFGKKTMPLTVPDSRLLGVLTSQINTYNPAKDQMALVEDALASPIGSALLSELAKGKEKVVIIASDHTRPVPSRYIIPPMLREIRKGNPNADILIMIATGCHRPTTREELIFKFGEEIVENEKIIIHDCDSVCVNIGILPSGGECLINKVAVEADLLLAEGFIEPHFFAGFSGGRKSVLPGIAARKTVLANHCSEFIASENARTGIIDGNPIHNDMLWAAKKAGLKFIVNVVINDKKEVVYAVAGDAEQAHRKGCDFLLGLCKAKPKKADIAVSTNGGYPLDQNIYQAVKGMTAAEATVKEGGVIIMVADSSCGHGGEEFYNMLKASDDLNKTMALFLSRGRNETVPDQWEAQILVRILLKATVIYVSTAPDELARDMHMIPAKTADEALKLAEEILGNKEATVTVIPDGVSLIVTE